jgi:hypothetical protein
MAAVSTLLLCSASAIAAIQDHGSDGGFAVGLDQGQSGPSESPSTGARQDSGPTKPADAKPADAKPADAKSADAKSGGAGQPPAPKSLDDLLGVPQDKPRGVEAGADAALDEQARRLKKSLEEASMDDLVTRAIDGMKSASDRLSSARDAGIGTQRIQDDVVRTLDRLLEEAQRQQQQRSSSRSSSRSQSAAQKQGGGDPQEQNGQQRGAPRNASGSQEAKGAAQSTGDTAAERERDDAMGSPGELDEARIEWGRLPERVRELVLQGRRDRVSSMYERLTREYYRRLAEEASK